jgi:hypothetical protein
MANGKKPLLSARRVRGQRGWKDVGAAQGARFVDRNLLAVDPMKEQFEPTDGEPIHGHKRMAGVE